MSLIIFTAALLAVARIVEQFEVELDFAAYRPVGVAVPRNGWALAWYRGTMIHSMPHPKLTPYPLHTPEVKPRRVYLVVTGNLVGCELQK